MQTDEVQWVHECSSVQASLLTAVGVGSIAGPCGILGSVMVWLATEALATFIKSMLGKIFGKSFTTKFGKSETLELVKSIYRYFEIKSSSGLTASLNGMWEYMKSTQKKDKPHLQVYQDKHEHEEDDGLLFDWVWFDG